MTNDTDPLRCPCCSYVFAGVQGSPAATPQADGTVWCADCAAGECHHDPFGLETPYALFPPEAPTRRPWYGPYAGFLAATLALVGAGYVLIGDYLIGGLCAALAVTLANVERKPAVFFEDAPLSKKGSPRGR